MKKRVKQILKIVVPVVILLSVIFLIYLIPKNEKSNSTSPPTQGAPPPAAVEYFSPGSDTTTVKAMNNVLYTNNPTTSLSYYATGSSGQLVHFRQTDRAFARILGVTRLYTDNVEIFHPQRAGSPDDTLFLGNITIPLPGKYLIKVCVGPSENVDANGTLIWPFGCDDSASSDVVDVYQS